MAKGIILCVDDDRTVLDSVKGELRRHFRDRFVLEVAQSADEAIEILDELGARFEEELVVISDWLMPGVRGDALLIRVRERFPQAKTILLSGQATEEAVVRARTLAGAACVDKPWSSGVLSALIEGCW
jgi:DNA-binding NtrC family response regulator